jgi:hypothetical protein
LPKLERYVAFFSEYTSAAATATPYTEHFPDALAPELLFLVPTESRRNSVREMVDAQRRKLPASFEVVVCTQAEARDRYVPFVQRKASSRPRAAKPVTLAAADAKLLQSAFNSLIRTARVAQAARVHELSPAELESVTKARTLLAELHQDTPAESG